MVSLRDMYIPAKQNGGHPDFTLLWLRTTPISAKIPSHAVITGRKSRANLPTIRHTGNLTDDRIREKLQHHQDTQKSYHDKFNYRKHRITCWRRNSDFSQLSRQSSAQQNRISNHQRLNSILTNKSTSGPSFCVQKITYLLDTNIESMAF